jgi:hypothetical protein
MGRLPPLREPAARPAPPPAASINPSFSRQGSNTGLLLGSQSLQAGQTGTRTFTARVTYPTGATTALYLTALPRRPATPWPAATPTRSTSAACPWLRACFR